MAPLVGVGVEVGAVDELLTTAATDDGDDDVDAAADGLGVTDGVELA
jgi:hypothetical protein